MDDAEIELGGETATTVTVPGEFPVVERRIAFRCSSGERIERDYAGVPVDAVVGTVELPGETTHVRVSAGDGHVACLAVADALDGLLAMERDGAPRFVAPGIAGPRAIKRVREMETITLAPGDDPEDFEGVPPDAV